MKKGIILGIVIGALLFGSIGVYATSKYVSKDISYTKQDGTTTNVENALNDLYNNRINENIFTDVITNTSGGERISKRTASIELEKGKYIVSTIYSGGGAGSSTGNYSVNENTVISCNNCTYKILSNLGNISVGSTRYNNNAYINNVLYTTLYYLETTNYDTIIISTPEGCSTANTLPQSVTINAVKIY